MISPVTLGTGPSATAARSNPEDLSLQRLTPPLRIPRPTVEAGTSRVDLSPEAVLHSQADGNAAVAAVSPAAAAVTVATDLAFAVADANQDGLVMAAEQQSYDARHLRITIPPAEEGGQSVPANSPIKAYWAVGGAGGAGH